jgi:hypothetical protein
LLQFFFQELISLLEYVEKVINSTAEASYLAGAEFLSGTLSERLYSAQQQVNGNLTYLKSSSASLSL